MLSLAHEGEIPCGLAVLNSARMVPVIGRECIILQEFFVLILGSGHGSFHAVKTKALEVDSSHFYSILHDALIVLTAISAST